MENGQWKLHLRVLAVESWAEDKRRRRKPKTPVHGCRREFTFFEANCYDVDVSVDEERKQLDLEMRSRRRAEGSVLAAFARVRNGRAIAKVTTTLANDTDEIL
ncbi:hypothetical protein MPTK1_6g05190 [Marchantia polymorpha subsp. ruderalis]|uniref:Uncharacterized protein n=2 Tax=Marchantia polymorpha TaxID=3197 RepID=A0AAF6BNQ6_MARPO|nr:hypothetical protein MARPO_0167s0002 [Marchantia polymorpha]BBN13640.1 hypothetical protein Mp_6g05190 [Marchantia polymorpha subsp. ruderalis]|eukprot:PTQ28309.1 hypothetical protein MARPO_0167s0002 [Marchantia polymorpha]